MRILIMSAKALTAHFRIASVCVYSSSLFRSLIIAPPPHPHRVWAKAPCLPSAESSLYAGLTPSTPTLQAHSGVSSQYQSAVTGAAPSSLMASTTPMVCTLLLLSHFPMQNKHHFFICNTIGKFREWWL